MMRLNKMGKFDLKLTIKELVKTVFVLITFSFLLAGCFRGTPSEKPAIHLNPNMDDQQRYDPQEESPFFRGWPRYA